MVWGIGVRKLLKWATFGLLSTTSAVLAQPADQYANRAAPGFWQTDQAKLLDTPEMIGQLVRLTGEGNSGEAVSNEETQELMQQLLLAELATERGVKIETLLTALGAVSGFACQMIIREELIAKGALTEEQAFMVVGAADGSNYYFGDLLNEAVAEPKPGNLSIWSLVAGAPHHLGKDLPDLRAMFERTSATLGTDSYGRPDVPERHQPDQSAEALLAKYWNVLRNQQVLSQQSIRSMHLVVAQLAQRIIIENKDMIDPTLAAQIVMEAAISMSKLDPDRVPYAYLRIEG